MMHWQLLFALIPLAGGLPCTQISCKNGGTCLNHSNGSFTCLCFTGYVGDLCQFVDPCTHKQCQNGGTCSLQMLRPPNPPTSTCLCLPGFTGEQCQGLVGDPCFPSPCQHGGSCQRLSGKQYQCQCVSGWTGKNCQLMDFCPANPCANGGTCVITYPVIVCQCRPGFEGHTCQHDVNECFGDTNPCLNGGRCINSVGSFRCVCPPNSSGPLCQYRLAPCSPEICLNGGTCHEVDERYHGCLCLPGYTGQYCEVNPDDCVGNQCSNGGTCLDGLGSYSCQCLSGWTGLHCHLHDACLGNACHPDAHCDTDLLTGHAVCTCQQGYTGALCNEDIDECQMGADPCEHGGSCHNTLGSFTCRCPEGYTGSRCESNLNECLSQPCHNGASCLDLLGKFQCLCPSGFSGPLCEVEECVTDHCLNGGTCLQQTQGFTCKCLPGFEGPRCKREVDGCASNPCRNGGQCQNSMGIVHCTCPPGFEGHHCEREANLCHSGPCDHGTCVNTPGSFTCVCSPGFTGPLCVELSDPCQNWQCLHGGTCQVTETGLHCFCQPGWAGEDCGTEINACDSSPCYQEATCISQGGTFSCLCPSGYQGITCEEDVDECQADPCLHSGSCLNSPGTFRCLCPQGYAGPKCQITLDLCSPNPCGHGGQCVVKDSAPHCLCSPGWTGSRCQRQSILNGDNCTDPVGGFNCQCLPGGKCPNGGTCIRISGEFRCLCPLGTTGPRCDVDPCSLPGPQCYYGGTCVAQPDGFSCICPTGYVGKRCEGVVDACFSQPCHRPGAHDCQSSEHGFHCLCAPGYTGRLCETVTDSCQANPCLNGGSCTMMPGNPLEFTCHCPQGYEGTTCDQHTPSCGPFFCHNGGVCISPQSRPRCLCVAGFSGLDCRQPPCSSGSCAAANDTLKPECQKTSGDGRCDRACSSRETNWDGGDCSLGLLNPWGGCPKQELCQVDFRNGHCQRSCDSEGCLHDGFDCVQQKQCNPSYAMYCRDRFRDGHCDRGCNVASCGWDGGDCLSSPVPSKAPVLGLVVLLPRKAIPLFLHSLTVVTRAVLQVMRDAEGKERIYPYTGKEELGSKSNWTQKKTSVTETIGFTIFLIVDSSLCSGRCPTSPKSVLNILGAMSAKGSLESLIPHPLVAAWLELVENDPQTSLPRFSGPLLYGVVAGVLVIALGIFVGVWRIRRPQHREHGSLWFPPGFAPHQSKKRRRRREPLGEDAIGLKPMKMEIEFVEETDMFSSPHYDGPLNTKDVEDDSDCISVPDQGQPKPKRQMPGSTPTQEKSTRPKSAKNREPVCGLTPLMPLAASPGLEVEGSWTDQQPHNSGETPLHLAARFSRADAARRLLASGADVNARDQWGRTPLHSAVAADALGVFQILLRQRQTDLDASTQDGSTPLILATRLAVENMVEELVANHADVRATDKRGKSALHWAAAVNNVRAALVLLRNGADKDALDNRAQTPLFLAAQEGSYQVASLLLQHGAKQNIRDHLGRLPKDVARERLHHDIVSLLDQTSPSCGTGQLSPHRPRPQAHRTTANPHRLAGQSSHLRLTPVPEKEDLFKEAPNSSTEDAARPPAE
ncbi:neurogenic locus notch homolog protein 4 [Anolis carolinensis]|uniref:neurogenic locus notch homolog protein 4 n=1 Tax=Anolis carolinensis TaxID=28377 RepID=UPI00046261A8|nr:PREDICTED: neurogenic locus notch homolog protein 4 [Anolis carolinensis]|eukprot:XP_008104121.1 PREDICTED: neurogenic locus notch homolog protein 4 [Anolis carolinensis]